MIFLLYFTGAAIAGLSSGQHSFQGDSRSDLLQLRSGKHLLGFGTDRVYFTGLGYALVEEFVGANSVTPISGSIISDERKGGHASELQQVQYSNLWPGVTLSYNQSTVGFAESVFTISAAADPRVIRLRYKTPFTIQEDGSLRFERTDSRGWFTQTAPVAWQEIDGKRIMVKVAFEQYDKNVVGYRLGAYDPNHVLLIDPTYQWHTFYGSSSADAANAIAVDAVGNIYVGGWSSSNWLANGGTSPLHAHSGNMEMAVIKLDATGAYQWHTFYGGASDDDYIYALTLQGTSLYVAGGSDGSWVGPSGESPLHAFNGSGNTEIVILKLDLNGTYQWHTFYGASGSTDVANDLTVDSTGYLYATGYTGATWLGEGATAPLNAFGGARDFWVLKLSNAGAYQWHTFYGSTSDALGYGIAADGSNNVYVVGNSNSTWTGPGMEAPIHAYSGDYDILVVKLNQSGAYQYHSFYGASVRDAANCVAVDGGGNVYIGALSDATWQGDGNTSPLHTHSGNTNFAITKLNASGVYQWHTFYGSQTQSRGIALDTNNNVYITGYSQNGSWLGDNSTAPLHAYSGTIDEMTTLSLDQNGVYLWHTFYGSSDLDHAHAIAIGLRGAIYVVGRSTQSWVGDDSTDPLNAQSGSGNYDMAIFKLASPSNFPWGMYLPAIQNSVGN